MELTGDERKVCELVEQRRDRLLEDLRTFVNIPTGKGHREGLAKTRTLLVDRLEALGARTREISGEPKEDWLGGPGRTFDQSDVPATVVCSTKGANSSGAGGRGGVLIAGHMDTVHDPESDFRELVIDSSGVRATGPGCVDMKGGLVIAVHALEVLAEAGMGEEGGRGGWTFLLNSDEETGSYHSAKAIREVASEHKWGIALEPALAEGELAVERGGSGQFYIEVHGKSAHVGRAFSDGVSAVMGMARTLVKVEEIVDVGAGRILNVGPIEGGMVTNAVPELARAWGNARYPTEEIGDEIQARLAALEGEDEHGARVVIKRSFNRPAKPMTEGTRQLAEVARACSQMLGDELPFAKTGGVCDGNIMQSAGLPTIDTLGVLGGGLHTEQEWIELESLVDRCQLLALVLGRLMRGQVW